MNSELILASNHTKIYFLNFGLKKYIQFIWLIIYILWRNRSGLRLVVSTVQEEVLPKRLLSLQFYKTYCSSYGHSDFTQV